MSVEWERIVKPVDPVCTGCRARLLPGGEIVTTLDLGEEGFRREDLCPACFGRLGREPFSFWKHARPTDARPGPRKLDLGYLTEFFKRLETRPTDPQAQRVRWIVALLLLRRRILEETGRATRDGLEVLSVRLKREDLSYEVTDPSLDAAAIASIEGDLSKLFDLESA